MNKPLSLLVFGLGLAAIGWVALGYLGSSPLALAMTLVIALVYVLGALELRRFQQATDSLHAALADDAGTPAHLDDWLDRLHPTLRPAVRLRVEGERAALPGPALTPYLVGLLVLLGMLGTFLGMVVTLNGAVLALETTTDLPTIRAALAAPVKGLGLAFGTSVAGVAGSAMLGLLSALCRRSRLQAARALDGQIATRLRSFTLTHQREQTLQTLQQQAQQMPEVVGQLQALMAQMLQQSEQLHGRLLAGQERFHAQADARTTALAAAVDRSLRDSLEGSARAAGATIQPLVESTMAALVREGTSFHHQTADRLKQTLTDWSSQFDERSTRLLDTLTQALARQQAEAAALDHQRLAIWAGTLEASSRELQAATAAQARDTTAEVARLLEASAAAPRAAAELVGQMRQQLSDSLVKDTEHLAERQRLMAALEALLQNLQQHSSAQHQAVDALVAGAAATLQQAGQHFGEQLAAQTSQSAAAAAQVSASAVEVASLGEAFGVAVQMFSRSSEAMTGQLQRIEAALGKSSARSDEQLAYYVAQAREIVELSISAQQQIVDDLRQLAARPAPAAEALA